MSQFTLTPAQEQVVAALSGGATISDAAREAGIHRNTIANWRRASNVFRSALDQAYYDRALAWRENAESHAQVSLDAIRSLVEDSQTPAATRLRAAIFLFEKAATPPVPHIETIVRYEIQKLELPSLFQPAARAAAAAPVQLPPEPEILHNSAQPEPPSPVTTYQRSGPKTGRNELCPCGSGIKFKRCCLGKPAAACQARIA